MRRTIAAVLCLVLCGGWISPSLAQEDLTASTSEVSAPAQTESLEERVADILSGNAIPETIDDLRAMQDNFSEVADRVKRATVGIDCGGAQGSGVIISRDGLILTAAHVIGRPGLDASIRLADGRVLRGKTKGMEHHLDSGLLQITDAGDFDYLDMGESDSLKLGQWVMAVGHPGGYEESRGIVVRVGRVLSLTSRVIRTDCTLVGGDSGGPLVDMDGNVIGIHSRIGLRLTDNMHVPISVFSNGWDDLESDREIGGRPGRPTIGVRLKGSEGLEVESVQSDGPAEKAGIQPGDFIAAINDKPINTRDQLGEEINKLSIGGEATIKVLRGTEELEMRLVVEGD